MSAEKEYTVPKLPAAIQASSSTALSAAMSKSTSTSLPSLAISTSSTGLNSLAISASNPKLFNASSSSSLNSPSSSRPESPTATSLFEGRKTVKSFFSPENKNSQVVGGESPRIATEKNLKKLKRLAGAVNIGEKEIPVTYFKMIRLNRNGIPQQRVVLLTSTTFYTLVPKMLKLKRKFDYLNIHKISMSSLWDNVLCIHLKIDMDVLLICKNKVEVASKLQQVWLDFHRTQFPEMVSSGKGQLEIDVSNRFVYTANATLFKSVSFLTPDGTEDEGARVIVDMEVVDEPTYRCTPSQNPAYLTEDDSGDEGENTISVLLNRMMNIVPFQKKKDDLMEKSKIGDNYVYYKWLCDPNDWNLRPGLDVKLWQLPGERKALEDKVCIDKSRNNEMWDLLVCLFDGHGGKDASEYAADNIKEILLDNYKKKKDMKKCLLQSVKDLNAQICKHPWSEATGTTALIMIIKDGLIHAANVGDCRAIIVSDEDQHRITVDHKISNPSELQRITAAGGVIKKDRLHVKGMDINLARALGDRGFQPYISNEADYFQYKISPAHRFIAIGCDGIFDVVSDEAAANILRKTPDPKRICSLAYGLESHDNLSVIVVYLQPEREKQYFERQMAIMKEMEEETQRLGGGSESVEEVKQLVEPTILDDTLEEQVSTAENSNDSNLAQPTTTADIESMIDVEEKNVTATVAAL